MRKDENMDKKDMEVKSMMKLKVGGVEEKTQVGIVRRPRKEVQGCVQDMEVNKKV